MAVAGETGGAAEGAAPDDPAGESLEAAPVLPDFDLGQADVAPAILGTAMPPSQSSILVTCA